MRKSPPIGRGLKCTHLIWTDLGLEQVGNPHDRHSRSRVRSPFRCGALGTGPDMVLLGHKFLAVLHNFELALGDVADHGILHVVGRNSSSWLENNVTHGHLTNQWC